MKKLPKLSPAVVVGIAFALIAAALAFAWAMFHDEPPFTADAQRAKDWITRNADALGGVRPAKDDPFFSPEGNPRDDEGNS